MKRLVAIIIIILISIATAGCDASKSYTGSVFLMDTYATMKIYGGSDPQGVYNKCVTELNDLDARYDVFSESSYLYKLNNTGSTDKAGGTDSFIIDVFKLAKTTNFAFDPAIFPVSQIWEQERIKGDKATVPEKSVITAALKKSTMKNVVYDENSGKVTLKNGAQIDLGGAVKGYATDQILNILKQTDTESAVIDLGGNVLVYGKPTSGDNWTVAIRAPRDNTLGYFATLTLPETTSVVTSGDYERYFEVNGVRYHHIIDPSTGYPTNNGLISVTIICKNSLKADVYSTAVFVMGLEKGMQFVNNDSDVQAVFVTSDKKVYVTDGIRNYITIEDEEYTLQ